MGSRRIFVIQGPRGAIPPPRGEVRCRFAASGWGVKYCRRGPHPTRRAKKRATLPIKGRDGACGVPRCSSTKGERVLEGSLRSKKGAGGAGQRSRIRRGGEGQRHGNLLEHANTLTQMLDETFAASPTCFLNARRQKLTDVFAVWNVVTHGHKLRSRSCFVLTLSPIPSQGEGGPTAHAFRFRRHVGGQAAATE